MTYPRPRRASRRRRRDDLLVLVQLIRLEEIAAGRRRPETLGEQFFARLHAAGRRPDPRDFVLPAPLAYLEREVRGR